MPPTRLTAATFARAELHDTLKPLALERGYPYVGGWRQCRRPAGLSPRHSGRQGARSPVSPWRKWASQRLRYAKYPDIWAYPGGTNQPSPVSALAFPMARPSPWKSCSGVGRAERYLRNLGLRELRVRSAGDTARIEIPVAEIKDFVARQDIEALVTAFQSYGFTYVTLDLEGFRSGKLNQVLAIG